MTLSVHPLIFKTFRLLTSLKFPYGVKDGSYSLIKATLYTSTFVILNSDNTTTYKTNDIAIDCKLHHKDLGILNIT